MKNFCIGFLLAMIFVLSVAATKEGLYRRWGPLLLDATVQVLMARDAQIENKINEIIVFANANGGSITDLPEVTGAQAVNSIDAKLNTITPYPWMLADE